MASQEARIRCDCCIDSHSKKKNVNNELKKQIRLCEYQNKLSRQKFADNLQLYCASLYDNLMYGMRSGSCLGARSGKQSEGKSRYMCMRFNKYRNDNELHPVPFVEST